MAQKAKTAERKPERPPTAAGKIIMVANPKGGVGKTATASGTAFALKQAGLKFTIIDADHENPDIYKQHMYWSEAEDCFVQRDADVAVIDRKVRTESDFIELGNIVQTTPGTILVNTPAGSGKELLEHWQIFFELVEATGRSVTTLFPIDRGRDTVEILIEFIDALIDETRFPQRRLVVLKNLFFGDSIRFRRFDHWAQDHRPATMMVRNWPELNEIVIDKLADERANLSGGSSLTLVERTYLQRYRDIVVKLLIEVGVVDG